MEKMRAAKTEMGLAFKQGLADQDVWQALTPQGEIAALVIVYVDDFLVVGGEDACRDIHQWFSTTWETTPPSWAKATSAVRFLGMETKQCSTETGEVEGCTLDQEGYVEELLRHHGIQEHERSLIPTQKELTSLDPSQFPTSHTPEELKLAQSLTGELAWLAQRCRPDLSYTVSIMGSLATRDPARVALIGHKALRYLNATKEWKMKHKAAGPCELVTYTDSSYAPDGGKSHGGAGVFWAGCPIAWKSSRQTLMTTSSAETELLEASEGALLMYSIDALL